MAKEFKIADRVVLKNVREFRKEAEDAKGRKAKDDANVDVMLGKRDFSHKQEGQSRIITAKQAIAIEHISAFVKRSLVKFGDWFTVKVPKGVQEAGFPISEKTIKILLQDALENLDFYTLISDAIKVALNNSLMVFKVYGKKVKLPKFIAKDETQGRKRKKTGRKTLVREDRTTWQLAIDLLPTDEYKPDPSGKNLFKIHSAFVDLAELLEMAEDEDSGLEKDVLGKIQENYALEAEKAREARRRNQKNVPMPAFRKQLKLDEYWGMLFDEDGKVIARNIQTIIANDKFVLMKARENRNWHGDDPFVASPMVRVPHSVWHKAMMDDATPLGKDRDELMSLMLDGAFAAVHGVKGIKPDDLVDDRDISGGVPTGSTLRFKSTVADIRKSFATLITGNVPTDAMAMLRQLSTEHEDSMQTSALNFGQFPPRQVKATEVVEASANRGSFFDNQASTVEDLAIEPILEKAWKTMLQHVDEYDTPELVAKIGKQDALVLQSMTPEERFAAVAIGPVFKVFGLSAAIKRIENLQKKMGFMQLISDKSLFITAFIRTYSLDKFLRGVLKDFEIDPDEIEMTDDEKKKVSDAMDAMQNRGGAVQGEDDRRGGSASDAKGKLPQADQSGLGLPAGTQPAG